MVAAAPAKIAVHDCTGTDCLLGRQVPALLERLGRDLDGALARELTQVRIADLADDLRPH